MRQFEGRPLAVASALFLLGGSTAKGEPYENRASLVLGLSSALSVPLGLALGLELDSHGFDG